MLVLSRSVTIEAKVARGMGMADARSGRHRASPSTRAVRVAGVAAAVLVGSRHACACFFRSRPWPIMVTLSADRKIASAGQDAEAGCALHVGLGVEQHRAPVGVGRLHAEAEVGQRTDGDQLVPEPQEPHRHHRPRRRWG